MNSVQFTPLGGIDEVGANSYLLEIDGLRLLIDCGLHPKKEGREALPKFDALKQSPHAVIISHAHIDHCGSLPLLIKMHPSTTPYCTRPTLKMIGCCTTAFR